MHGASARVLAGFFSRVVTVEKSRTLWTWARTAVPDNVTCVCADSAEALPTLLSEICPSVVFLDAHWWPDAESGPINGAKGFPLWEELASCRKAGSVRLVIVDDVFMFGRQSKETGWEGVTPERIVETLGERVTDSRVIGDQFCVWLEGVDGG